jgi:hypothetical protein
MPPLLKVAARNYLLHKSSSFPSWCKFALSKFITLQFFFHPLKENTLSKQNLHKQQAKQTRDRKKEDFLQIPNSRQEITNGKA